jgi:hypothetical protein
MRIRLQQPPQQGDREPEREVGDVIRQHVGRIGDANAPATGEVEIDLVEADAIDADHLEVGQRRHQRGSAPRWAPVTIHQSTPAIPHRWRTAP